MTAIRCFAIACFSLVALMRVCVADDQPATSPYFGNINPICSEGTDCSELRTALRLMEQCKDDKECKAGNALLGELFGVYVPGLPKVIFNFEQCQQNSLDGACTPTNQIAKHIPVLMWDKKKTPHVYGARQIYALVFAERKMCITGGVTINYRSEPNPLSLIASVLGSVKLEAPQAKPSETKPMTFRWFPLTGNYDPKVKGMWVALGGLPIDENTASWLSVEPSSPRPKPAAGAPAIPDECIATETQADEIEFRSGPQSQKETVGARKLFNRLRELQQGSDATLVLKDQQLEIRTGPGRNTGSGTPPAGDAEKAEKPYATKTLGNDAFFSNSPGGRATVAIALAHSSHTGDTSLGSSTSQASSGSFNGYALVKWYLLPPRLRPLPDSSCFGFRSWMFSTYRCPSVGVVLGTNIKSDAFAEIVYGVSFGHIWDNVGIVTGWNLIADGKNGQTGRQRRPFVGIEYSF